MRHHPVFDELDESLAGVVPSERVEFSGNWLPATRRTYAAASQAGTGSGPYADVIDWRWQGVLRSAAPTAAVAFLATSAELFWSKSIPPASELDVRVSLHAYADYLQSQATFMADVGRAILPGIKVAVAGDPAAACTIRHTAMSTSRVELVGQTEDAAFLVLLLPAQSLKIGRHRLWRLREELASSLPARVREILTRGRSGSIRVD